MRRGLFITFEGIDGCGKSTQMERAASYLSGTDTALVVTREPGGTIIGEKIRELLISPDNAEMCDECETLLYLAARAQHVAEKIIPAIEAGGLVLCDRFQEATFAYQGYGRGFDVSHIKLLNGFASRGLAPDLTLVYDIGPACASERMKKMGKAPDRLEQGSGDFFTRVRQGYLRQAAEAPERMSVIDAEESIEAVWNATRSVLDRVIAKWRGQQESTR